MLRVSIVTNELPPYRIGLFRTLGALPDITLEVAFCCKQEPNRQWNLPVLDFGHVFLPENIFKVGNRYIHSNPSVFVALRKFRPDVIITGGFNPTHLYAFSYARLFGTPHITMTDGTASSEQSLTRLHRAVRHFVYRQSKAFIVASDGGLSLMKQYNVSQKACFKSHLCIDNGRFTPLAGTAKCRFDFLFCGRLEAVKNPMFALDVAAGTAQKVGRRVSILFVGAGSEEQKLRDKACQLSHLIDVTLHDFTPHDELPALYRSAKLFLFPTTWDPWGVVANEACAAGLPVLISPNAGAANELVVDDVNGFVRQLDVDHWADAAAQLITNRRQWELFSRNSREIVKRYNYADAAANIEAACRFAINN